jgi:hypothetical protein
MSHRALNTEQFEDHLPPEPGSQPIPEGHVRLWHYTEEQNLPSIRQHGLLQSKALGHTYKEPSVVWAAAHEKEPAKLGLYERPYVEFHADPGHGRDLDIGEDYLQHGAEHLKHMYGYQSHVTMRGDVPTSRILGIHEPWHAHVRYLERDAQTLHDYTQGDFKDSTTGDPHTDKALAYVRAKHAAGGYK